MSRFVTVSSTQPLFTNGTVPKIAEVFPSIPHDGEYQCQDRTAVPENSEDNCFEAVVETIRQYSINYEKIRSDIKDNIALGNQILSNGMMDDEMRFNIEKF